MAVELLALLPGLLLLILANYTEKRREFRIITQIFLGLFVLLVVVEGLLIVAMSKGDLLGGLLSVRATYGYGIAIMLTGLLASMLFLRPVREGISRIIDIDEDNWLHTTAMVFAILLVGTSLATAANVDISALSGGAGGAVLTVLLQDSFFVISALFGVGWMVRRDLGGVLKRLGLVKPRLKDICMSIGFLGLLFAIVIIVGLMSIMLDYDSGILETKDDPTVQMVGGITILTAILFALGASIGEEILFRGAMQPRLGVVITSLVFTAAHVQYPSPVQLGTLFAMSVVFGYERIKLNTSACIITHALYDMILLLGIVLL